MVVYESSGIPRCSEPSGHATARARSTGVSASSSAMLGSSSTSWQPRITGPMVYVPLPRCTRRIDVRLRGCGGDPFSGHVQRHCVMCVDSGAWKV
jgi:hypothetical protein